MRDLYKRLGVPMDAPVDAIRQAARNAEQPTRDEAEFILLEPRRRAVYDRSHRVLSTIGQLRGRLALGLRPFWSHGDHRDFMQPANPTRPRPWNPRHWRTEYPRLPRRHGAGWWLTLLLLIAALLAAVAYTRGWVHLPRVVNRVA